jgi:hypothetical protein
MKNPWPAVVDEEIAETAMSPMMYTTDIYL